MFASRRRCHEYKWSIIREKIEEKEFELKRKRAEQDHALRKVKESIQTFE